MLSKNKVKGILNVVLGFIIMLLGLYIMPVFIAKLIGGLVWVAIGCLVLDKGLEAIKNGKE